MPIPLYAVSAAAAVVTYFSGALSGVTVRQGWPETDQELDLGEPLLTVEPGPIDRNWCPPTLMGKSGSRWVWRIAHVEIQVQIDLWTAYQAQRDDTAQLVEDALHNRLPIQAGLFLTSTGYHNRALELNTSGAQADEDGDSALKGQWRYRWDATIKTDLVALTDTPEASQISIDLETEVATVTTSQITSIDLA